MRQYEWIDSDTHMIYPPNMWEKWLSKKFQDRAPKLVKDQSGEGDAWRMDPDLPPEPLGLTFAAGKRYEDMKWSGSTYDDIRPGAYDGPERLKDMDFDGVDAGVVYSDNRTIGQVLGFKNKDQQLALIQAYNDWLLQEFCATDTARARRPHPDPQLRYRGLRLRAEAVRQARRKGDSPAQLPQRRHLLDARG